MLTAAGCYARRDEFIRKLVPEFGPGWGCKVVIANALKGDGYNLTMLVVQSPDGTQQKLRMPLDVYLGIVAATNMKQRTRKQIEYYHADRLNYAVIGTPNRLEYDQGFFVKNGDGAADVKPIAHLYKSQVYALAEHLGVPEEIRRRPPTTDTWSLRADAGGVLLLAALRRDGPLPVTASTTASRAEAVAQRRRPHRRAGRARLARHRRQAPRHALSARAAAAGRAGSREGGRLTELAGAKTGVSGPAPKFLPRSNLAESRRSVRLSHFYLWRFYLERMATRSRLVLR